MRWVLAAILVLLSTVPAVAQQRLGRVTLEDGRSFEGVVLHLDEERIQLEVEGRRLTFRADRIAGYEAIAGRPDPAAPAAAGPESTGIEATGEVAASESGEPDAPATDGEADAQSGPAPAGSPTPAPRPSTGTPRPVAHQQASSTSPHISMLGRRIGPIAERYPWLSPSGTLQLVGVAVLALLYLTLAMQLGAWFADAESREVPKAIATSVFTLVATVVQFATVPFDFATLPMLLVGNIVVWLLLTRILYGLGFFASCTMFFCAVLMCGMAFGIFEIVNYVLDSPGAPGIAG